MYKSKNHSKYSLKVHIVFVTKYRKNLLQGKTSSFIKHDFLVISQKSSFNIEIMETDKNHIHLLIDYEPKISIL